MHPLKQEIILSGLLLLDPDGGETSLPFVSGGSPGFNESWIQKLIYEHPTLVPSELLESSSDQFIPICRELPLASGASGVFLDVFGVTLSGTPVLIECKLWRNPQARREVIGQILEYSALLQGMDYEDLVALCRKRLGTDESDPLLGRTRRTNADFDEARFVDRVSKCLQTGKFILIVAGDGIRADIRRVVDQLSRSGGFFERFGLLELRVAQAENGLTGVVPIIPFEADRVRIAALSTDPESDEEDISEPGAPVTTVDETKKQADRAFWDRFIADVRFDYSDQPRPRHGGRNRTRVVLPAPLRHIRVYRARKPGRLGMKVDFSSDAALELYDLLKDDRAELESEISSQIVFRDATSDQAAALVLRRPMDIEKASTEEEQIRWLADICNRTLNALRPRISRLAD
jgi:hypothetical protein